VRKASVILQRVINAAMAISIAGMAILVFGNVVLRYVFNSGITWSEEMSRYLFVWLIFFGAIGALKDKDHLKVDIIIEKLPPMGKKIAFILSNVLMLIILWIVFDGSWKMTMLNLDSKAPATGIPYSFMFGIGIVAALGMAAIIIVRLYRALRKGSTDSLQNEQTAGGTES
jgi:TRAP-type transport system small permease protein